MHIAVNCLWFQPKHPHAAGLRLEGTEQMFD
jgi:hypothetical protein